MGRTACTEPQCLYSIAIPLLPLWAVRPVQSLSACTVQLYLYSSYGPYSLYRTSVPVQYSYTSTPPMGRTACTEPQYLYSIAIPLLPLRAVRPAQSLSTCRRVHFTFYAFTTSWDVARYLSRYSDWLRAGRSGDRIPVGGEFSAPVQTGPGAHPASCTMVTGSFSEVKSSQVLTLTPHLILVLCSRKSRAIPILPLCSVQLVQSLSICTV